MCITDTVYADDVALFAKYGELAQPLLKRLEVPAEATGLCVRVHVVQSGRSGVSDTGGKETEAGYDFK